MLPQRDTLFQQIGLALIEFIKGFFGTKFLRASYAGFALENGGNHPGETGWKMLEVMFDNQKFEIGANNFVTGYASLGWLVKFNIDSNKKTDENSDAIPESITQLIAHFTNGQVDFMYKAATNHEVPNAYDIVAPIDIIDTANPAKIPTVTRHWVTPYISASHRYFNSISTEDTQIKKKNFQYYQRHTELVFFSRTQLEMVHGFRPTNTDNHRLFFSGYELLLGRTAMKPMMQELTRLSATDIEDPIKWFSLKLETINIENYTPPNSFPTQPPPIDGSTIQHPFKRRGVICASANNDDDGIPFPHYGQPCPPEWDFLTIIMEETFRLTGDTPSNPCSFVENLHKALMGNPTLP